MADETGLLEMSKIIKLNKFCAQPSDYNNNCTYYKPRTSSTFYYVAVPEGAIASRVFIRLYHIT